MALVAATVRLLLGALVIDPLTTRFWPPAVAFGGFGEITGHAMVALRWFFIAWTFAAFGEEIAYRGYLLTRAADVLGRSTAAYCVSVIVTAVLFGYGHYPKGPAGMLNSGAAGAVLGAAYILSGRNLWVCIVAHGIIDTVGITALYFGVS